MSESRSETHLVMMRVTYRVRAHQTALFERLFRERLLPVVREREMRLLGVWRSLVGEAGEYLELWTFDSMEQFERQWKGLLNDSRVKSLLRETGPLVEDEKISLFEPWIGGPEDLGD